MGKLFYNIFLQLYVASVKIISPFNEKAKLWIRGRKKFPSFNFDSANTKVVWIHCASLGEFEQGRPVLEEIKKQYPSSAIVLSFFSPSGYEAQKNYSGAEAVFYLPMDSKANAKKLIKAMQPSLVIWVKYEYWFYYLDELKLQNIPVILVSGIFRKGHPFFKWYGKMWDQMLQSFDHFFVQDKNSKYLLGTINIKKNVTVSGDTRFDRVIAIAEGFQHLPVIREFCKDGKVIVAGSTWEDDETEWVHYIKANPNIRFIIAPHETSKLHLAEIKKMFKGCILYSELVEGKLTHTNLLVIDNVGMLSRLYYYADITYVGGGFGDDGVHNVLEAAVYGKPVIYGPEFEKFIEAGELTDCGGGISIGNALELEKVINDLWKDEDLFAQAGSAAKNYVYANAGATQKILHWVQEKRLLIN